MPERTIYKYPVPILDEFTIVMPECSAILSVQVQDGAPFIWALVDSESPLTHQKFALRGTGHDCRDLNYNKFIGTFQLPALGLVYHLFRRTP